MVVKRPKLEQREATREAKALMAAKLEKTLEKELVARLKSRAYGDAPLNVNEDVWKAVLDAEKGAERELELEDEESDADAIDDEDELEFEDEDEREFVSDIEESDDELGDLEDGDGFGLPDGFDDDDEDEEDDDEPPPDRKGKRRAPPMPPRAGPSKRARGRASIRSAASLTSSAGKQVEIEYERESAPRQFAR